MTCPNWLCITETHSVTISILTLTKQLFLFSDGGCNYISGVEIFEIFWRYYIIIIFIINIYLFGNISQHHYSTIFWFSDMWRAIKGLRSAHSDLLTIILPYSLATLASNGFLWCWTVDIYRLVGNMERFQKNNLFVQKPCVDRKNTYIQW